MYKMSNQVKKHDRNINKKEKRSDQYKKFIGSRAEGQGFADKRKKKIHYEYLKLKKKEDREARGGGGVVKTTHRLNRTHAQIRSFKGKATHQNMFTQAQTRFQIEKEEKIKKRKEIAIKKSEIDKALEKYSSAKKARHMKLCKRTFKGQPVMKNQIEYLLEKIQKQTQQQT